MLFSVSGVEISPFLPLLIAFGISFFTSMGGVSGAFLLLPFQVSVLGFISPSVSSTNLVYNIVATPSGIYRYLREGRMNWPLAGVITVGTLPGVLAGVFIRIRYLPDPTVFKFFVGCVLFAIGGQLLYRTYLSKTDISRKAIIENKSAQGSSYYETTKNSEPEQGIAESATIKVLQRTLFKHEYEFMNDRFSFNTLTLFSFTFVVGLIGGAYGIGGGSLIAPFCIGLLGLPVYIVAGATLLGTFITSISGVIFYSAIGWSGYASGLPVAPDWMLGLLFGIGGFFGMYCGARLQKFVPEKWIKLLLGILITGLGLKYVFQFFY